MILLPSPFRLSVTPHRKLTVGWHEAVALPDWGVAALQAKIDTGARSSAVHVDRIEPLSGHRVGFDIILSKSGRRRVHVVTRVSRTGRVRSSTGHTETRFFVNTRVRLGTIERAVELSLVDRSIMRFRMLLGRTALNGVLVDPSQVQLLDKLRHGR